MNEQEAVQELIKILSRFPRSKGDTVIRNIVTDALYGLGVDDHAGCVLCGS